MNAKEGLIFDVEEGMSIAKAAAQHGVTRSCAYKWVERYRLDGLEGLEERSRRPEFNPKRVTQEVVDELVKLKKRYPDFGPAKLVLLLESSYGEHVVAVSTASQILDRHGLVQKQRRAPSIGRILHPAFEVAGAGDSMTADFKGEFRMLNRALCFPLTVADPFSRFILCIRALPSTAMSPVKAAFERIFCEHGIPRLIITDNGKPFCSSVSLGGLTQLSRWWIEQGVTPLRIERGRPQQNGIHERMHRTLKQRITRDLRPNLVSQQRCFNAFRREFNQVRPHAALGQKTPATAYRSYRSWSSRPRSIEYDSNMDVRRVNANGEIKWKGELIFTSDVLSGTNIGLVRVGESLLTIHYGHVQLGYLDELDGRVRNRRPEHDVVADHASD